MKTRGNLALAILLAGGLAYHAYGQTVTIGEATFDETSNQPPADGFAALTLEVVQVFDGYGDYAGFKKTRKCSLDGAVSGVNAISCRTAGASALPEASDLIISATGERIVVSDTCSLAYDTAGNLRVLTEGETETPPILIPATPTAGQSWAALGKTFTVIDLNASRGGEEGLLKLKVEVSGPDGTPVENGEFEYHYIKSGAGLVAIEASASDAAGGSGWNLAQ